MSTMSRYTLRQIKDGTGFAPDAQFETVEDYNGWTNRETWAVALYINNDQGWQESVHEALRTWLADLPNPDDEIEGATPWAAGDIIRDNVSDVLEMLWEAAWNTVVPAAEPTYRQVIEDIGSLWRVNWSELGASFLSGIAEASAS